VPAAKSSAPHYGVDEIELQRRCGGGWTERFGLVGKMIALFYERDGGQEIPQFDGLLQLELDYN
jgi:hypothetical protein